MDMELKDYFYEMRLFTAGVERRLGERIDGVEKRLGKRITGLEKRMGAVEGRLHKLDRRMKAGFRAVDRRLLRMDAKLDVLIRLGRPDRPA